MTTSPIILVEAFAAEMPHVFCDMDGVVADFYGGLYAQLGIRRSEVEEFLTRENGWSVIEEDAPHLFRDLPELPDARKLMQGLVELRDNGQIQLSMLTAIPNEWYANLGMKRSSTLDKIAWVRRHFPAVPADHVLVVRRDQKERYARAQRAAGRPPAILIDDFRKNIREWEAASGWGILHTSASTSLRTLIDYLR